MSNGIGLGPVGFRISATGSAGLDWPRLDATWAQAGELEVFSAGWLSDHLSDASRERGGTAFEALTTAAALAHRVPGKWIGIAVAANTFRHPAVLAKQATMLDIVTGGRFILGLGAGWHAGEHEAFGVPLPPPRERFDRYESSLKVLAALFSDAARESPGVTLDDPLYPLDRATNEPPPASASGPQLWLGGQRRRGIELMVRYASGWPLPGNRAGDVAYFTEKRNQISRALEISRPRSCRVHLRRPGRLRRGRVNRGAVALDIGAPVSWRRRATTSSWASPARRLPKRSFQWHTRSPNRCWPGDKRPISTAP